MPRMLVAALVAVLLAACQANANREEIPGYFFPVGAKVVLHQALTIPEGRARIFLQKGQASGLGGVNQYYPHCNFEVRTLSDGKAQVPPATFVITRVRSGEEMVVNRAPRLYAALGMVAATDDSGGRMVMRLVHYELRSEAAPDVMRLTCHGAFDDDYRALFPTMSEAREALGGIATVLP